MRYSFSSKAVGKAAKQFIFVQHKLHGSDLDVWELVQLTCTLCCETTIKLIKGRKLLLLFPQFIKYKTFELLWNLDITAVMLVGVEEGVHGKLQYLFSSTRQYYPGKPYTGKNTKSQLKYSLYLLLLRHRWITIVDSRSYCTFTQ